MNGLYINHKYKHTTIMLTSNNFIKNIFICLLLFTIWSCAEPTPEEKKATETARLIKILTDSTTVPSLEDYSYKNHTNDSFSLVEFKDYKDIILPSVTATSNGLYLIKFPYVQKDSVLYYSVTAKLRSCGSTGFSAARLTEFEFIFEIQDLKNWMEFAKVTINTKSGSAVMTGIRFKESHSFNTSIGEYQSYFFNKK